MKKVLTNNIVENTRRMPFGKNTLDHIQEMFLEYLAAITKVFTTDTASYIKMYGVAVNFGAGTVSAGVIYHNGEVYYVDATTGIIPGGGDTIVFVMDTTYRAGDPVKFSDNNDFNVHEIKKLKAQVGAPGSGLVDAGSLVATFGLSFVTTQRIADNSVNHNKITDEVVTAKIDSLDLNDYTKAGVFTISGSPGPVFSNRPDGVNRCQLIVSEYHQTGTTKGVVEQVAIVLQGANIGKIYHRSGGFLGFGAWTVINDV